MSDGLTFDADVLDALRRRKEVGIRTSRNQQLADKLNMSQKQSSLAGLKEKYCLAH